jgi:hypothetical protein
MDVFLILQILFDAVLLFGILFLFHFSVNQQQKKKEEFDIVKNIQVQEMKENLENLSSAVKQLGKDVSDDIQKKINEFEIKNKTFNESVKKNEKQLNRKSDLSQEVAGEKDALESAIVNLNTSKKAKLILNKKDKDKSDLETEKSKTSFVSKSGYSVGFSSAVIKQVYKLVDSNKEISEVVKVTKLTRAEISLILNLRENRFTAPN